MRVGYRTVLMLLLHGQASNAWSPSTSGCAIVSLGQTGVSLAAKKKVNTVYNMHLCIDQNQIIMFSHSVLVMQIILH